MLDGKFQELVSEQQGFQWMDERKPDQEVRGAHLPGFMIRMQSALILISLRQLQEAGTHLARLQVGGRVQD